MAIRSTGPLSTGCVINRRTFIITHSHSGGAWPPLVGLPRNVVMPQYSSPRVSMGLGCGSAPLPTTVLDSAAFGAAPGKFSLSHQEQGVEHDRLSEGDGQNRLDQNLRRSAGITSYGFRSRHADQADRQSRAKRCQTNVYAANHIVYPSFPRGHRG